MTTTTMMRDWCVAFLLSHPFHPISTPSTAIDDGKPPVATLTRRRMIATTTSTTSDANSTKKTSTRRGASSAGNSSTKSASEVTTTTRNRRTLQRHAENDDEEVEDSASSDTTAFNVCGMREGWEILYAITSRMDSFSASAISHAPSSLTEKSRRVMEFLSRFIEDRGRILTAVISGTVIDHPTDEVGDDNDNEKSPLFENVTRLVLEVAYLHVARRGEAENTFYHQTILSKLKSFGENHDVLLLELIEEMNRTHALSQVPSPPLTDASTSTLVEQLKKQLEIREEMQLRLSQQCETLRERNEELSAARKELEKELQDANLLIESTLGLAEEAEAGKRSAREEATARFEMAVKIMEKRARRVRVERIVARAASRFKTLLHAKRVREMKAKIRALHLQCENAVSSSSSSSSSSSMTARPTPSAPQGSHASSSSTLDHSLPEVSLVQVLSHEVKSLVKQIEQITTERAELAVTLSHATSAPALVGDYEAKLRELHKEINAYRLKMNEHILKRTERENELNQARKELNQAKSEIVSLQLKLERGSMAAPAFTNQNHQSGSSSFPSTTGRPSIFVSSSSSSSASASTSFPARSALVPIMENATMTRASSQKQRSNSKDDHTGSGFGDYTIPVEDSATLSSSDAKGFPRASTYTNNNNLPRRSFYRPSLIRPSHDVASSGTAAKTSSGAATATNKENECAQQ